MFSDLFDIFKEYGTEATIICISGIVLFIIFNNYIKNLFQYLFINKKKFKSKKSLINHRFFSNIKSAYDFEVLNIKFVEGMSVRDKMFRRLMQITLKTYEQEIEKFIKVRVDEKDYVTWGSTLRSVLYDITDKIRSNAIIEGIPEKAIERFEKWHAPHLIKINEYVDITASSTYFDTTRYKSIYFLYYLETHLMAMLAEASGGVFSYINGELTGLDFNGEKVE